MYKESDKQSKMYYSSAARGGAIPSSSEKSLPSSYGLKSTLTPWVVRLGHLFSRCISTGSPPAIDINAWSVYWDKMVSLMYGIIEWNISHVRRFLHYVDTLSESEEGCIRGPKLFGQPCLRPREQRRDPRYRLQIIHGRASRRAAHSSGHPMRLRSMLIWDT